MRPSRRVSTPRRCCSRSRNAIDARPHHCPTFSQSSAPASEPARKLSVVAWVTTRRPLLGGCTWRRSYPSLTCASKVRVNDYRRCSLSNLSSKPGVAGSSPAGRQPSPVKTRSDPPRDGGLRLASQANHTPPRLSDTLSAAAPERVGGRRAQILQCPPEPPCTRQEGADPCNDR